ncbi:MAG: ribosome-associated translation inhibitor RaiA [Candidatus Gastranaerophilales bacterium]|nr:ribosome-associated translation inhibitor RaiA [Candidatus Gastranaerophilales bacterium]
MAITVNGKNIDITPAIRSYIDEKIGKVANHFDQVRNIVVTLNVIKNPSVAENHTAEVTCFLDGAKIHVTEEAESMYASIDLVSDKLNRQVKKHKDKLVKGKAKNYSIRTSVQDEQVEEIEEIEETTEE